MSALQYYQYLYASKCKNAAPKDYSAMLVTVIETTVERHPNLMLAEKDALKSAVLEDAKTYCDKHYHDIRLADCEARLAEINTRVDAFSEIHHS